MVGELTLYSCYTIRGDRAAYRRLLRVAETGENDVAIVRRNRADIDDAELERMLAEYRARPPPTEEQIEAWAEEDERRADRRGTGAHAPGLPAAQADEIRALRERLSLTRGRFADRFGFAVDEIAQYEQRPRACRYPPPRCCG